MKNLTLLKNNNLERNPSAHSIEQLNGFVCSVYMVLMIVDCQEVIPPVPYLIETAEKYDRELGRLLELGLVDINTDIQGGK